MRPLFPSLALLLSTALAPAAPYADWTHSGSVFILTTPEGADLPADAAVENFPLLVRLQADTFDFSQAQPQGQDLRFASPDGTPLPYQIENWDPARGQAAVWVRLPRIQGNATQELRLFWGRPAAASESSGPAVFNESNGYCAVWHLGEDLSSSSSQPPLKNQNATSVPGRIGSATHCAGQQGLDGGPDIAHFPTGSAPHTTQAWFRAEKSNGTILAWGNERAQGKVVMQFRSPPHVTMDCYFSDANVKGNTPVPLGEWVHVVHCYEKGNTKLYLNGVLEASNSGRGAPLNLQNPAKLWIGGWYGNYDFVGDIDEVRLSQVSRSPHWVQLEYANQKTHQSLVGPVVPPGHSFALSPTPATLREGEPATFTASVGGAQKLTWILQRGDRESVVAVDQLSFTLQPGRVLGDQALTLKLRALYPNGVKTASASLVVQDTIPEPTFALQTPASWDGRSPLEIVPNISSPSPDLPLHWNWKLSGPAVDHAAEPGKLTLRRALGSGPLTITLSLDNGGAPTVHSALIQVSPPVPEPWIARQPDAAAQPQDNQFYACDADGFGTLFCRGTLATPAPSTFLRLFADDHLLSENTQPTGSNHTYAYALKLKPGLIKYRIEFGVADQILHAAQNLVCGDAFLIIGQSNAVSTDWGQDPAPALNPWVRTFGSTSGGPEESRLATWAVAAARAPGGKAEIGYWGMELGRRLVESQSRPICLINGAVGGTRIDQHQRSAANPTDPATIYGRLLWRVRQAGLTHGIRGVLWHQGENDQGADGPTGGFGYETYRAYFHQLAASWKQDYPNIQHFHLFQIWPKSCSMGFDGSDNRLREVQRTLPQDFSNLSILSTLGITPPGGCHYPAAGYAEFARLLTPLMERHHYGKTFPTSITPPNLLKAAFTSPARDAIALTFDQPVAWSPPLATQFYLDGKENLVAHGLPEGNTLTLHLAEPSAATNITYLDSKDWSQAKLLLGANGLAALTFCEVTLAAP